jgi:hypothetical protein
MATAGSSEILVKLYQIIRGHNMVIIGIRKFTHHFVWFKYVEESSLLDQNMRPAQNLLQDV